MWCEPEFHRAGHGKMFMENKENESLKISAKLVDLEDAEEFLKKSAIGKEKIKIAAGDKKSEKVSMEVPVAEKSENFQAREDNCEELNPGLSIRAGKPYPKSALDYQRGLHPADEAGCFPVPQVKGYCIV